jgi:hypothetical protein
MKSTSQLPNRFISCLFASVVIAGATQAFADSPGRAFGLVQNGPSSPPNTIIVTRVDFIQQAEAIAARDARLAELAAAEAAAAAAADEVAREAARLEREQIAAAAAAAAEAARLARLANPSDFVSSATQVKATAETKVASANEVAVTAPAVVAQARVTTVTRRSRP